MLRRLSEGCTNKQIAHELGITTKTVEFHVSKILKKHGVGSRFDLKDSMDPARGSVVAHPTVPRCGPGPTTGTRVDTPSVMRSALARLTRIMFRPDLGFPAVATRPDLATPAVSLAVCGTVLGLSAAVTSAPSAAPLAVAATVTLALVITLVVWLLVAGPVYLMSRSAPDLGGPTRALSLIGYALLPEAMRVALQGVGVLLAGADAVGPGVMVHAAESWPPWADAALATLNVFSLWTAVLLYFAVSTTLRRGTRKSIVICAPLSLVSSYMHWGLCSLPLSF